MLSGAEATCRTLAKAVRDELGRPDDIVSLAYITLDLARTVRAQGRLDEARRLCEEANNQESVSAHLG